MAELIVVASGVLTTIQDAGRPGYASMGVSRSGAFDVGAYELGNRLVGNAPGAASLEVLLGGITLRVTAATRMAVTGGLAQGRAGDRAVGYGEPFTLLPDEKLVLGRCTQGIRLYVSVAGGIVVPPVLGSRASDSLSGLGPSPLAVGDVLPLGATPTRTAAVAAPLTPPTAGEVDLDVLPGPRANHLDGAELTGPWTVAPDSNRVGVRLSGRPLAGGGGSLPSQGLVRGAIQLPPSGLPVIFGPDHPTTGGYPVIGVLTASSFDRLAQLRPGQRVRFRTIAK